MSIETIVLEYLEGSAGNIEDFAEKASDGPDGFLRTAVIGHIVRIKRDDNSQKAIEILDEWLSYQKGGKK